jgi:hypothetical protein
MAVEIKQCRQQEASEIFRAKIGNGDCAGKIVVLRVLK